MPEQRRKFSPQFRAEAVQMVIETGKPVAEVARDLGVNDGTFGNWVTGTSVRQCGQCSRRGAFDLGRLRVRTAGNTVGEDANNGGQRQVRELFGKTFGDLGHRLIHFHRSAPACKMPFPRSPASDRPYGDGPTAMSSATSRPASPRSASDNAARVRRDGRPTQHPLDRGT